MRYPLFSLLILAISAVAFRADGASIDSNATSDPTPLHYRIGYITKDHPEDGATIAGWLGRPLDILGTTITMSAWFVNTFPASVGISATVPMLSIAGWDPLNAYDLGDAAAGKYDGYYKQIATAISGTPAKVYAVRFGWECNGNWYPWSAGNSAGKNNSHANYIATFQRMAKIFRQVIPGVKIEFNTNYGAGQNYSPESGTPEDYWPGKDSVDIISMDFYETNNGSPFTKTKSGGVWNLDWMVNFAKKQGVKVALSEWGCAWDDGGFTQDVIDWMNSLGDLFDYQTYSCYDPADQIIKPGQNPNHQYVWTKNWKDTKYVPPTSTLTETINSQN